MMVEDELRERVVEAGARCARVAFNVTTTVGRTVQLYVDCLSREGGD